VGLDVVHQQFDISERPFQLRNDDGSKACVGASSEACVERNLASSCRKPLNMNDEDSEVGMQSLFKLLNSVYHGGFRTCGKAYSRPLSYTKQSVGGWATAASCVTR